ncbi:RNA polymerase sigma factor [Sphingobacterium faecale]|uniref:RNA polymerase sigma-70 factor n=1 Tax=Sphingobacterium faecale TaxID=2803775 RepID=A0ABS1R496_9SPHI|nr:RNA polymerase sigma-70 factor [Sphingobacterium faecale]MBL1409488.1 RNA polymerase sigma-70 factor [Sphingobacterium faecale]
MHLVEKETIRKLQEGSLRAFEQVYDTLSHGVYSVSFNLTQDRFLAEEVVQEVFVKLWGSRDKLNIEGNLWVFLYVVSKRLSLNKIRSMQRQRIAYDGIDENMMITPSVEQDIFHKELELLLERSIADLPKQQQIIIDLSRNEQLTHREIAERLGLSTHTVRNHMAQALKNLRRKLQHSDAELYLALIVYINKLF